MPLKRTQIPDFAYNTTPTSNKIAAGLGDYELVNVFDRAFGANNARDEFRIKRSSRYDLQLVEMADKEPLDWSQFINYDIGRSSQAHSCLFDPSSSSIASPLNSFYATTPSLLSSNIANDLQSSPQIATPGSYTSTEVSAESSRDLPETCQQLIQDDLSEVPRELCLETREPEIFPALPATATQQSPLKIPAHIWSSSSFSPPSLLLDEAPTPDIPSQRALTPKRQCQTGLDANRRRTPGKTGQKSREVDVHAKGAVKSDAAAERNKHLVRNRVAAHKCRERKKAHTSELLRKEEFFATNNAKLPHEIEQTMLELRDLRALAFEHCRACPCPSVELVAWFETEMARLQHSKTTAPICHNNGLPTPLPQDSDITGKRNADKLPL